MLRYRDPDATALVTGERRWTVGDVVRGAELSRDALRAVKGTADACVLLPTSRPFAFVTALFGCHLAGAVAVPWRDEAGPPDTIARVVRPNLVATVGSDDTVTVSRFDGPAYEGERRGDVVMMTSGSTGEPKGVALDLSQIMLNAQAAGAAMKVWQCAAWSIDIDLGLMSALNHMLMAWQYDLPLYFLRDMDFAQAARVFAGGGVGFGGSPIQLVRLRNRIGPGAAMLVSSGDFLMPSMIDEVAGHFPETPIHKLYGLTELGGRFCCMPHRLLMVQKDAAGLPLPGFETRVDAAPGEVGEIEAKTPLMAHGYYRSGEGFGAMPSPWFATGDIGTIDQHGVVTVVGRADDVLKVGGEKVDRQSIEMAVADIMAGREYCVLAVEHRLVGKCAALFIASPAGDDLSWAGIVAHIKAKLPSRFVPSLMYRLPHGLPRLDNGKIDRERLKRDHGSLVRLT